MITEKLRDEIIESQKVRTDLIKWKLILVAAIGAASLESVPGMSPRIILLALIPFVCLYVDTVCFHNDIRIMAIGAYLRTSKMVADEHSEAASYETFCLSTRRYFKLEGFALLGATFILSLFVLLVGLSASLAEHLRLPKSNFVESFALAASGGTGIVLGCVFYLLHRVWTGHLDARRG